MALRAARHFVPRTRSSIDDDPVVKAADCGRILPGGVNGRRGRRRVDRAPVDCPDRAARAGPRRRPSRAGCSDPHDDAALRLAGGPSGYRRPRRILRIHRAADREGGAAAGRLSRPRRRAPACARPGGRPPRGDDPRPQRPDGEFHPFAGRPSLGRLPRRRLRPSGLRLFDPPGGARRPEFARRRRRWRARSASSSSRTR